MTQNNVDITPLKELTTILFTEEYSNSDMDDVIHALCIDYSEDCFSYSKCRGIEPKDYIDLSKKLINILNQFDYELLESSQGEEGGGEYCYGVFKLKDKIYKAEYSYYSHRGDNYRGILNTVKEVYPKQKTITVYE